MATSRGTTQEDVREDRAFGHHNLVELVGRLSCEPQERELPSGDRIVTFRLVVERPPATGAAGSSRQRVDTIDCVAWAARVRRSALAWPDGCTLEVAGALRRRFRRSPTGPVSRVEVEVRRARQRRQRGCGGPSRAQPSAVAE